jgi:hypothetical protein
MVSGFSCFYTSLHAGLIPTGLGIVDIFILRDPGCVVNGFGFVPI